MLVSARSRENTPRPKFNYFNSLKQESEKRIRALETARSRVAFLGGPQERAAHPRDFWISALECEFQWINTVPIVVFAIRTPPAVASRYLGVEHIAEFLC